LLRPKALNKVEQLLLQDALDKGLVSMECMSGEGNIFPSADGMIEKQSTNVEEDRSGLEGDDGTDSPPAIHAWLGPLADQASKLF
jgi:hypothetical protein